jgi:hypothetical protein
VRKLHLFVAGLAAMVASGTAVAQSPQVLGRYYIEASRATGDTASAWSLARLIEGVSPGDPGSAEAARLARSAHPIGVDASPDLLLIRLSDNKQPFSDVERTRALETVLAAAADNGYLAIMLMASPEMKDDAEAVDRLVRLAAHAPRFDGAYSQRVKGMFVRLSTLPMPPAGIGESTTSDPDDRRFILSVALTAIDGIPAWTYPMRRCKVATGAMQDDCRALGQRLVDYGATIMDGLMGAALLRISATTPEQRARADLARRVTIWRQEKGSPERGLSASDDRRDLALYRKTLLSANELAAVDAVLRSRGLPLQPPAGWTSRHGDGQ